MSRAAALSALVALASLCAAVVGQTSDFFLLLEDGSKVTYGDLRALAGPNRECCFPVPWQFSVAYSSQASLRLFIANNCDAGFEINSSAFPALVKQIDLCAKGCDMAKGGCGLEAMNVRGVTTKGGKIPIDKGAACAEDSGRLYVDKTCKALNVNGQFAGRLQCKQDCSNKWTCQESSFDRSKCAGASNNSPVPTYVALGERCGYTADNKEYRCGGNKVSCTNGVCVSSYPSSGK